MSVSQQEAVDLAKDKDDVDLHAVVRRHGALPLAQAWDGAHSGTKSTDFTRANPWVHIALREGQVEAVKEDVSHLREHDGNKVFTSHDEAGNQLTIDRTVFKGE